MKRFTPLLAIGALLLITAVASACPACKDSVANTDRGVAAGFNNSIYFMLAGFFGCLALVARTVIKGMRGSTLPPGFPVRDVRRQPPPAPDGRPPADPGPQS